jgi:hypothetical protein
MGNFLQQLENNEAVLLMYLADELPPEDRVEVEQLLARDGGLRAELERLREMTDSLTLALTGADGVGIAPAPPSPAHADAMSAGQSAAVRRVSRVMSQQRAAREAAAARESAAAAAFAGNGAIAAAGKRRRWPTAALRLPAWTYPFAAAAVVLIAWVAYWGFTNSGATGQRERPRYPTEAERVDELTALAVVRSLDPEESDQQALSSSSNFDDPSTNGDLASLLRALGQESSTQGARSDQREK